MPNIWTLVLFCADYQYSSIIKVLENFQLHYDHLYWIKPDVSAAVGPLYTSAVENIVVAYNPSRSMAHFNFTKEEKHLNWIQCPPVKSFYCYLNQVVNHSEKPIPLLTNLIEHHSRPGDLVVDLFAGSGSATAAGLMAERNVLALELCEKSVEAISARIPLLAQLAAEKSEEELNPPKEDPKDQSPKSLPPTTETVCKMCAKGPEQALAMCSTCGQLGHPTCTPFYNEPRYLDYDDKENIFWCSLEHFNAVSDFMNL